LERGESRAHSHFDAGHLELQVEGEDVLIDTGRFIYSNSAWRDWRDYFYSSQAHNTVGVDDHRMGDVPGTSARIRCLRTWCHRFEPGPDVDLIEVSHNGYAFMEEPVFHLRRVVWIKPGLWLVDDVLTGVGNHRYNLSFNFPPRPLIADGGMPGAYVYHGKQIRVRILPLLPADIQVRMLEGSLRPKGGWVSYGYAVKVPAPQLIYAKVGSTPTRFLTAIVQEGKGDVRLETADESGLLLAVTGGNRIRHVTFGGQAQQWTVSWE
jgi:hypothetical protein